MNADILNILQMQLLNFQKMREYIRQQHDCLVANDDTGFQTATNKAEVLMNEIKKNERSIAKQILADADDDKVKKLQQEIKKIAEELKAQNKSNETLLSNRMNFINFNINVATQATADISYQPGGSGQNGTQKIKMFDQSI